MGESHENDRHAVLDRLGLLDTAADEVFDRLTRLATQVLQVPVALVVFVAGDRQVLKGAVGLREPWASQRETPLSHSFCQHEVASGEPLIVGDAREHPFLCNNSAISDLGVIAYAGIPLRTSDGQVLGSFCAIDHQPRAWTPEELAVLADFAATAMTEIELRTVARTNAELYHEAQEAVLLRDRFVSIASHELKTPLTSMRGYMQLLRRQLDQPQLDLDRLRSYAERVYQGVSRLGVLVDDLLDASRGLQGRLDLRPEPCDLAEVARQVVERIAHSVECTPQHVIVLDTPAPVVGTWDCDRLDQVVTNLVSNAVKYSPAGGEVRVTVRQTVDRRAELIVSDQGIGIPAAEQPGLFQPFARASAMQRQIGGTGLGLYIVRQIAEAHDGTVNLHSAAGRGTTITVRLPLETPAALPNGTGAG